MLPLLIDDMTISTRFQNRDRRQIQEPSPPTWAVCPLIIEIIIFLDFLDTTILFFLLLCSSLLAILYRIFILYISIAIWIIQVFVLSSLHFILISWAFFLFSFIPRELRMFHLNPAPRHKLARMSGFPSAGQCQHHSTGSTASRDAPPWWSQRRQLGGCWRVQERRAGMHTGGSVAHITASFTGFHNHSNGLFIIRIMENHVHISSLLLKLNCVCIAKF